MRKVPLLLVISMEFFFNVVKAVLYTTDDSNYEIFIELMKC